MRPLLFLLVLTLAGCGSQGNTGNLRLKILSGNTEAAFRLEDKKAKLYVVTFLAPECPLSVSYTASLNALKDSFSKDSILFMAAFSGTSFSTAEIRAFSGDNALRTDYTIIDDAHRLQQALKATVTPEAFVLDAAYNVVYSGKIDNWIESLGVKRQAPTEFYLKDALNSLLKDEKPGIPHTQAVGCYIE